MKANRIITSILLAVAFFALPALTFAQTDSAADDPDSKYATELLKPGTPAPDFTLTTPDGKTVKLSDYRGKYVVIDFWASWCPDCRKDAPAMAQLSVLCVGIFAMYTVLSAAYPFFSFFREMAEESGFSSYAGILLRVCGIGVLTRFAADFCRDAGESALAGKAESQVNV